MSEHTEYLLGSSLDERDRLLRQCELYSPEARSLLDRVGIQPGWRAVDVGCGPLGILDLLSERVGPAGAAVGLDNESRMLEWARISIAERKLANVEIASGEASSSGLPKESFDFAHARLVLINVPHPDQVVREIRRGSPSTRARSARRR